MTKEISKLPPLLDLTMQYQDITNELIRSETGELTPELEITKDQNKSQIMEKLDTYHYVDENLANTLKRLQMGKKKYDQAIKTVKNKREFLKSRLSLVKDIVGSLVGHMGEWKEHKNPPKLEVTNAHLIDRKYYKLVLDEDLLKTDLLLGIKVKGAELTTGSHLRYKEKL